LKNLDYPIHPNSWASWTNVLMNIQSWDKLVIADILALFEDPSGTKVFNFETKDVIFFQVQTGIFKL